jgi:hypothetical protein
MAKQKSKNKKNSIEVLFVEDDLGDRELTTELLNGSKLKLRINSEVSVQ